MTTKAAHTRYLRKLARDTAREQLRRARVAVKDARAARKLARARANQACKDARVMLREWSASERARVRAEIARLRAELKQGIEARREAVRQCCGPDRVRARAQADAMLLGTRTALSELMEARRLERTWSRKDSTTPRRGPSARTRQRERAQESDHEVEVNLTPDQLMVWQKVKDRIRASDRRTRTEAFLEWLNEHEPEASRIISAEADRAVREAEREEAAHRKAMRDAPRASESKLRQYLSTGLEVLGVAGIPLLSPAAAAAGILSRPKPGAVRVERKKLRARSTPKREGPARSTRKGPLRPTGKRIAPAKKTDDLATFAARVVEVAKLPGTLRHGGDRAWLGSVYDEGKPWGGLDLEAFKARAIEAHRKGLLQLTRADLSSAFDYNTVERSEAKYLGASFHFVALDEPIRDTVDGVTAAIIMHESGGDFEDRAHEALTASDDELRDYFRRAMDLELSDLAETRQQIRWLLENGPNAPGKGGASQGLVDREQEIAARRPPAAEYVGRTSERGAKRRGKAAAQRRGLEAAPEWRYMRRAPDGAGGWHHLYEVTPQKASRPIEYKPGDYSHVKYDPSEGNGTYTSSTGDRYQLHETSEGDGIYIIAKALKPGQQGHTHWSGGQEFYIGPVNMTARQLHEAARRALSRGANPRHYKPRRIASVTYQDGPRTFSFWTHTPDGNFGPTMRGDGLPTTWETQAEATSAARLSAAAWAGRLKLPAPREARHFKSPEAAQAELRRISSADMQSSTLMTGAADTGPAPKREPFSGRTRSDDKRLGLRITAKQLAALRALRSGERVGVNAFGKQWEKMRQAGYINLEWPANLNDVAITSQGLRLLEEHDGDSVPPVPF